MLADASRVGDPGRGSHVEENTAMIVIVIDHVHVVGMNMLHQVSRLAFAIMIDLDDDIVRNGVSPRAGKWRLVLNDLMVLFTRFEIDVVVLEIVVSIENIRSHVRNLPRPPNTARRTSTRADAVTKRALE
jgi:hypothetical protein